MCSPVRNSWPLAPAPRAQFKRRPTLGFRRTEFYKHTRAARPVATLSEGNNLNVCKPALGAGDDVPPFPMGAEFFSANIDIEFIGSFPGVTFTRVAPGLRTWRATITGLNCTYPRATADIQVGGEIVLEIRADLVDGELHWGLGGPPGMSPGPGTYYDSLDFPGIEMGGYNIQPAFNEEGTLLIDYGANGTFDLVSPVYMLPPGKLPTDCLDLPGDLILVENYAAYVGYSTSGYSDAPPINTSCLVTYDF